MPVPSLTPLNFPLRGYIENMAMSAQPDRSTPDCLNVRAYDSLDRRNRGGQRTGQSKFFADAVNSSNLIQFLGQSTEAVSLVQTAGFSTKIDDVVTGSITASNYSTLSWHPTADMFITTGNSLTSSLAMNSIKLTAGALSVVDTETQIFTAAEISPDGGWIVTTLGSQYNAPVRQYVYNTDGTFGASTDFDPSGNEQGYRVAFNHAGDVVLVATQGGIRAYNFSSSTGIGTLIDTLTGVPYTNGLAWTDDDTAIFHADTSHIYARTFSKTTGFGSVLDSVASTVQAQVLTTTYNSAHVAYTSVSSSTLYVVSYNASTGFSAGGSISLGGNANQLTSHPSAEYVVAARESGGGATTTLVYDVSTGTPVAFSDPASPITDQCQVGAFNSDGGMVAFSTVTGGVYTATVWDWTDAGLNPTARESRLIVVSGGSVYRSDTDLSSLSIVGSGSGVLGTPPVIFGAEAFQNMFFCDGTSANYGYLKYADNSWNDWATDVSAGTLPQGSDDTTLGCSILTVYRGRVVMAGLREDPQNWFMSKSGDPFDWDYSPATTTATQAVAGNNSDAGKLGDVLTALAPYQDDVMLMGGSNSIWIMRGDPAAGGNIDNITRNIGIVGGQAWTWNTSGTFYFFGINGLYKMDTANPAPELISKGRLDKTFSDVDISTSYVRLIYDPQWQGVHVFITPLSQPTTAPKHWFWDERNDAFWPDEYPIAHGPTAVLQFNADNPENNAILLGGFDSYIRAFDSDATTDDGTDISSHVVFTPIQPGDVYAFSYLSDLQLNLAKNSGSVTCDVFSGDTPEIAIDRASAGTNPRIRKVLTGVRNNPVLQRIAGNAFTLRLHQNSGSTWAYEQGGAKVSIVDRLRGRGV